MAVVHQRMILLEDYERVIGKMTSSTALENALDMERLYLKATTAASGIGESLLQRTHGNVRAICRFAGESREVRNYGHSCTTT